jgi:hypothetical protein
MDKNNGLLHYIFLQRDRTTSKETSQSCDKSTDIKESG